MGVIRFPAPPFGAVAAVAVARARGLTTTTPTKRSEAVAHANARVYQNLERRQIGYVPTVDIPLVTATLTPATATAAAAAATTTTSAQQSSATIDTSAGFESMIPISSPTTTDSILPSNTASLAAVASTTAASSQPVSTGKSSSAPLIGGVVGGIFLILIIIAFLYGSWQAKKSVGLQRQLIVLRQRERAEMRLRSAERGLEREWLAERRAMSRDSYGTDADMRELIGDEELPRYERCSVEDCPPRYTPPPPLTPILPSTPERTYQPFDRFRPGSRESLHDDEDDDNNDDDNHEHHEGHGNL